MARDKSELTDKQWEKSPFAPRAQVSPWGGHTPLPNRPCFEGILWILRTGARWKDLPNTIPRPSPLATSAGLGRAERVAHGLGRFPRPT